MVFQYAALSQAQVGEGIVVERRKEKLLGPMRLMSEIFYHQYFLTNRKQ